MATLELAPVYEKTCPLMDTKPSLPRDPEQGIHFLASCSRRCTNSIGTCSMLFMPGILRRYQRLPILISICIILSLAFLSHSSSNHRIHITNVVQQRLKHLQFLYITSGDYARDENEWEIHLGSVDYDAYVRDIQDSWRNLIGHGSRLSGNDASGLVPLKCVSEWLDIGSQSTSWSEEGQIPYRLHTTAKIPPSEFPYQFEGWAKLNPGYACLGSFATHHC